MFQNWCSGDSRTLAQSRLWLLEAMVLQPKVPGTLSENLGIPEPWRPGTQKLARTHCSRNLAQTLVRGTLGSRNLAPNPGSRNPGFPEPWFPEPAKRGGPWFAEPWVPGTLPRTLVPGTLGSRNPGSQNRRNEAAGSSSAPDHPEGYVGWDPKAFCCWGITLYIYIYIYVHSVYIYICIYIYHMYIYIYHMYMYMYIYISLLVIITPPCSLRISQDISGSRHEPVVVAPSKEPLNIW